MKKKKYQLQESKTQLETNQLYVRSCHKFAGRTEVWSLTGSLRESLSHHRGSAISFPSLSYQRTPPAQFCGQVYPYGKNTSPVSLF